MKILKSSQIRDVDSYTIKNEPIESIDLMERAAMAISVWINENIDHKKTIILFAGPGNNGGDALAITRQLKSYGFATQAYLLNISDKLSSDCKVNLNRLKENGDEVIMINDESDFPEINKTDVLVDGLFGSGLSRKLENLPKKLVRYFNDSNAKIIAIDIPSGLFGEDNTGNDKDAIIRANYTLTLQLPKLAFFLNENENFVGEWHILPIGLNQEFIKSLDSDFYYLEKNFIRTELKCRNKFTHKGNYGHVLLVAGGYGKMGAAVLAANACLRTGSGLVTVHVPKTGYEILQIALPEAMVSIDRSDMIFTQVEDTDNYNNVGIGPGIGTKQNTRKALANLVNNLSNPMVIDADGLNILSEQHDLISKVPKNSILTPHPKEFERLTGEAKDGLAQIQAQIDFSKEHGLYVVLKGAHTSISCPDGTCYFNTTGNPGMATAGSGDVLTGIILSLLGQGYEPRLAALIGVYLHGLAGDIASEKRGQESMIASDVIENLGMAFNYIKE